MSISKAQADTIYRMARELEDTGRICALGDRTEVQRNRAVQCALRDYLDSLTEPDMEQRLKDIAAIAHYGGLSNLSALGAMVLIRKLTLPYFDTSMKEDAARAAIKRAEGEA